MVASSLSHSNVAARISRSESVHLKSSSKLSEAPGANRLAMPFAAASAASSVEKLATVCPSITRSCLVPSDSITKVYVFRISDRNRHFQDRAAGTRYSLECAPQQHRPSDSGLRYRHADV